MSNLTSVIKETSAEVRAELDRLLPVPNTPERRVVEAQTHRLEDREIRRHSGRDLAGAGSAGL